MRLTSKKSILLCMTTVESKNAHIIGRSLLVPNTATVYTIVNCSLLSL